MDAVDVDQRTALMHAAVAAQPEACDLLLRCHARANLRDKVGRAPPAGCGWLGAF